MKLVLVYQKIILGHELFTTFLTIERDLFYLWMVIINMPPDTEFLFEKSVANFAIKLLFLVDIFIHSLIS